VPHAGKDWAVDTGFIVFNDWTYPNFIKLIDQLGVSWQHTTMSFSVKAEDNHLEYNGTTLNTLFAQRRNIVRPAFYRMIADILRFGREALSLLDGSSSDRELTLGEYLDKHQYSEWFRRYYIIPMGAAIWSAPPDMMLQFPAAYFVRFFKNHGMLNVRDRPVWRTIRGGSREYVRKMLPLFEDRVKLNCPVKLVRRSNDHVEIETAFGERHTYDHVILACHSDQALGMLADPSENERQVLGAIPYQENLAILHTDARALPKRRLAWAAWNYHVPVERRDRVGLTYNMNILQSLDAPTTFCVTLNRPDLVAPEKVIRQITYHHPIYTPASVAAQSRHHEISGTERTHYCGAYWFFGFHEDGVRSALRVCETFGAAL
jgi:predicted NAD/FAD-binding protein